MAGSRFSARGRVQSETRRTNHHSEIILKVSMNRVRLPHRTAKYLSPSAHQVGTGPLICRQFLRLSTRLRANRRMRLPMIHHCLVQRRIPIDAAGARPRCGISTCLRATEPNELVLVSIFWPRQCIAFAVQKTTGEMRGVGYHEYLQFVSRIVALSGRPSHSEWPIALISSPPSGNFDRLYRQSS